MGCDIHDLIEVEQPDGTWRDVEHDVYDGRDYVLFALLANVRYYPERMHGVDPVKKPTYELPRSERGRERYDGPDWHSLSAMDLSELEEVARRYAIVHADEPQYAVSVSLAKVIERVRAAGPTARYVFWFDN